MIDNTNCCGSYLTVVEIQFARTPLHLVLIQVSFHWTCLTSNWYHMDPSSIATIYIPQVLKMVSSFSATLFSGGLFWSAVRRFWNLVGSTAIASLTALSSFVFLWMADSPNTLTSSTTVSDTTPSEYSSQASDSGSCIPLWRSEEHFLKVSDSALGPSTAAEFRAVAIRIFTRPSPYLIIRLEAWSLTITTIISGKLFMSSCKINAKNLLRDITRNYVASACSTRVTNSTS